MYLNSGSCLELFNIAKTHGITQNTLYDTIFKSIEPNTSADYIPSNIKAGRANIPSDVTIAISNPSKRQNQLMRFNKNVMPIIEESVTLLIGAFLLFFEKDKTIPDTVSISGKKISEWKQYQGSIQADTFLFGVIAYAFLRGNRRSDSTDGIDASFLDKARKKGKRIYLQSETCILTPFQSNIPENARFQAVFHEISLEQNSDKVCLRLFHLDTDENKFSYSELTRYFRENLFRHVHTINEINGYKNDCSIASMYMDARSRLDELYKQSGGNIFDTLLVESCITDASNAPKVMNLLEHNHDGLPSGSHGIHFVKIANGNNSAPQILVAVSALLNDGKKALLKAFSDIAKIASAENSWKYRLFSQSLLLSKMPKEDARWIADTFIPKSGNQKKPQIGYGIFIGYSETIPNITESLEDRLSNKILDIAPLIADQIAKSNLESTVLNLYFLPFNDAENDKCSIVEGVLR